MTKPLRPVESLAGQVDWWLDAYPPKRVWIIRDMEYAFVGFVTLTDRHGFETPLFAIAPEHRGKGYARWFIEFYIMVAYGALAGEQLQSNEIICRLNKEAGWEIIGSKDGVDFLYHPGRSREQINDYFQPRMK